MDWLQILFIFIFLGVVYYIHPGFLGTAIMVLAIMFFGYLIDKLYGRRK